MKPKACKNCNMVFEGEKCPGCSRQEYAEEGKGIVMVFNPEKSEIAKNAKITKKGTYAISY